MKEEKNILIAFILNLAFSIFEFFGGIFYISNIIKKVTIKIQNYGSRRLGENSSRG